METRRITINIAGRMYPLNVPATEEEALRKVGKRIQDMIKEFEQQFDIQDKQDALAMCALRLGADVEAANKKTESVARSSVEKLKKINQMMDKD